MTNDLDDAREHIFRATRLVHLLLVFLPQHLEAADSDLSRRAPSPVAADGVH